MAKSVEKSRTTVGYKLYRQGISLKEIVRRVRVKVLRTWDGGKMGDIETSLDEGPWVNEGPYLLS